MPRVLGACGRFFQARVVVGRLLSERGPAQVALRLRPPRERVPGAVGGRARPLVFVFSPAPRPELSARTYLARSWWPPLHAR
jgi:hypothetical protein